MPSKIEVSETNGRYYKKDPISKIKKRIGYFEYEQIQKRHSRSKRLALQSLARVNPVNVVRTVAPTVVRR